MTYSGVRYGPAYHEFKTNLKPKGGMCDIIPYDEQLRELPVLNNGMYSPQSVIFLVRVFVCFILSASGSDSLCLMTSSMVPVLLS